MKALAIDAQRNVYVADAGNKRIQCRNENDLLIGGMTNWRVQTVTLTR